MVDLRYLSRTVLTYKHLMSWHGPLVCVEGSSITAVYTRPTTHCLTFRTLSGITAPTRVDIGKRKPRSREGEAFQSVLGLGKLSLHTSSSPSNGESPSRSYMRTFRTLSAEHRNEIKHEESRELLCRLRYERRSEID